jgi:hypothetical protein
MALSADRDTKRRDGRSFSDPVAAATLIYVGALVALNAAGNAVPADADATLTVRGVAQFRADNSAGAAGDINVESSRGTWALKNSAGADEIARDDIGANCYVVDDETVALTDAAGTRPLAGVIRDVDDFGVWVEV